MISFFALLFLLLPLEGNIEILDSWMRPNAEGMNSALYLTIKNTAENADTLYRVDSELAERVEIHETYSEGDVMGMREIGSIVIGAESTFELKPGAHHIMLMKLKQDIKDGDEGEFVLHFRNAGEMKISAMVKSR
jgi:copper(I)-binding protein